MSDRAPTIELLQQELARLDDVRSDLDASIASTRAQLDKNLQARADVLLRVADLRRTLQLVLDDRDDERGHAHPSRGRELLGHDGWHEGPRSQPCAKHKPVQHRDGREPWCNACGRTEDGRPPAPPRWVRDSEGRGRES